MKPKTYKYFFIILIFILIVRSGNELVELPDVFGSIKYSRLIDDVSSIEIADNAVEYDNSIINYKQNHNNHFLQTQPHSLAVMPIGSNKLVYVDRVICRLQV